MVALPIPAGAPGAPGTYCIDATEVTNQQYAKFLASNPTVSQDPVCSWNAALQPESSAGNDNCPNVIAVYDVAQHPDNPVACIDWCDAVAYCKSVGKRLCGKFGGGGVPFGSGSDAKNDQWYAACSGAGALTYPYGNTYEPQSCNALEAGLTTSQPVGNFNKCHSPTHTFLSDMSGNVAEWEDACSGTAGQSDTCYARGGFWNSNSSGAACNATPTTLGSLSAVALSRSRRSKEIGFRCCYDVK